MKQLLTITLLLFASTSSYAACKWGWVDHDYNVATAPIQKQSSGMPEARHGRHDQLMPNCLTPEDGKWLLGHTESSAFTSAFA